jgi:hypothetical protein
MISFRPPSYPIYDFKFDYLLFVKFNRCTHEHLNAVAATRLLSGLLHLTSSATGGAHENRHCGSGSLCA